MVTRGELIFMAGDSKLEMTLYEHGPGFLFCSNKPGLLGAVDQEPRNEFEGESSPKQDVRPFVEILLGLVKRENRLDVENPPGLSSIIGRLSTEIVEASVWEALKFELFEYNRSTERLLPGFLREGGA